MKTLFRLATLSLGLSAILALAAVSPLAPEVTAEAAAGWVACTDGSTSPGDRSGCTVYFEGYSWYKTGGYYRYDCPGTTRDVECYYEY